MVCIHDIRYVILSTLFPLFMSNQACTISDIVFIWAGHATNWTLENLHMRCCASVCLVSQQARLVSQLAAAVEAKMGQLGCSWDSWLLL
eukprot:COSAG01_NODE_735_length_13969_cov_357.018241_4_plen_89_part_00